MSYPAHKVVRIAITKLDGEVLDEFNLAHWKVEIPEDDDAENIWDYEGVGSAASESLLLDRIRRYVKTP